MHFPQHDLSSLLDYEFELRELIHSKVQPVVDALKRLSGLPTLLLEDRYIHEKNLILQLRVVTPHGHSDEVTVTIPVPLAEYPTDDLLKPYVETLYQYLRVERRLKRA